jgi:hypothetical protein
LECKIRNAFYSTLVFLVYVSQDILWEIIGLGFTVSDAFLCRQGKRYNEEPIRPGEHAKKIPQENL